MEDKNYLKYTLPDTSINKRLEDINSFMASNVDSLVECVCEDIGYKGCTDLCSIKDTESEKEYSILIDNII